MNKIISISVWGNKPQYCIGAIENAKLAKKLLPDWKCRIFVDHTVPIESQKELYQMDNVEEIVIAWVAGRKAAEEKPSKGLAGIEHHLKALTELNNCANITSISIDGDVVGFNKYGTFIGLSQ